MPSSEFSTALAELPPRTRRIRLILWNAQHFGGTTSAHAENTTCTNQFFGSTGNYLRARGEYLVLDLLHFFLLLSCG